MPGFVRELRSVARGGRWGRRPLPPASVADTSAEPTTWQFPTTWSRSRPARVARRGLQGGVLAPLLHSQLRMTVEGREVVREAATTPLILAPNHASHLDAPLVLSLLPPEVRRDTITVAASDYFFDAWWRASLTALVFNAVPIDRTVGDRRELPAELIADGNHLLVFPEGTRSHDGHAGRFRHGVAKLSHDTGAPIVPIAVRGSWRAMPRGQAWPSRGRPQVSLSFGTPLRPRVDESTSELTRRLEAAISVLIDEQRTDWWSAMRAAHRGDTPSLHGPKIADWRRRWELLEPPTDTRRQRVWDRRRAS
jgi:1-acyl-sn-glycerol-3-phosphate acyltransferase